MTNRKEVLIGTFCLIIGIVIGVNYPQGDAGIIAKTRKATISLNVNYNQMADTYGKKAIAGDNGYLIAMKSLKNLYADIININKELKIDTKAYGYDGKPQIIVEQDGKSHFMEQLPNKLRIENCDDTIPLEITINSPLTIEGRLHIAKSVAKEDVCEQLYYPHTYDPVKTTIDSLFYGAITDDACISAAKKIIDIKKMKYPNSEMDNQISIIKHRDKTSDGKFIGWFVYHKYRAANYENRVSFGHTIYMFNIDMSDFIQYEYLQGKYNYDDLYNIITTIINDDEEKRTSMKIWNYNLHN